jgi:formylglycine-generating enzyme required for sulfatase activity
MGTELKREAGYQWHKPGFDQDDSHPVVCVSWNDAQAYIAWLARKTGKAYRLLTEAEREYATRAQTRLGTTTAYPWGNEVGRNNANCDGCGSRWDNKSTAPVGSFKANAFGLDDMNGNAWEWVQDCYDAKAYENGETPTDGRAYEVAGCSARALRGGSWNDDPRYARSANRDWVTADGRGGYVGFRLARMLP